MNGRVRRSLAGAIVVGILSTSSVFADPANDGWWARPVEQLLLSARWARDPVRPFSTPARPRDLAGGVALSCERSHGRPCGDGTGGMTELDASAGLGTWISAAARLRARAGTEDYGHGVALARVHVDALLGPLSLGVGRDIVTIGPAARTQLTWGDQAPPLDQVRISTARPLVLGSALHGEVLYAVGRLGAPQTFPGNLVTIARGQLVVARDLTLGATQLLQLGGEGASTLGLEDFLLEHVRRRDSSASASDSSNRRVGFDVALRIDELAGARVYYAIAFEDLRQRYLDAIRYDADHVAGIELSAIGAARHGAVLEWQTTGVRSQEHVPRTTGFTNAGTVVGSPLGPDAEAVFGGARLGVAGATVMPWIELAELRSDSYAFIDHGPIERTKRGVRERRYRAGSRVRWRLDQVLTFEAEVAIERVASWSFVEGSRRTHAMVGLALEWRPAVVLGAPPDGRGAP